MKSFFDVAVIGAGPAGMVAALETARKGLQTILLDRNSQTGKKLRVTGGGRGNLTNRNVSASQYFCEDEKFVKVAIDQLEVTRLQEYFSELGITTYQTDDGWVYPVSNSAANVADLLEAHVFEAGVQIQCGVHINRIEKSSSGFRISSPGRESIHAKKVIIASGGNAYPELGANVDLHSVIASMGHTIQPSIPALVPLLTDMRSIHKLQGVRLDARVSIWMDNSLLAETTGNIIFTNWGVNGPGVMDLSHFASLHPNSAMHLQIDFIPGLADYTSDLFARKRALHIPLRVILGSVLPPKAARFFTEQSGLKPDVCIDLLSETQLNQLLQIMVNYRVVVKGTRGFEFAQVSYGGVSIAEVDAINMKSKVIEGLSFAGEIMSIIGPCGGYNLHWAFSSGIVAGRSI